MTKLRAALMVCGCLFACSVPAAADTINYTYDALGRLIQVQYVGGPNNGRIITYTYDAAGNRTTVVHN